MKRLITLLVVASSILSGCSLMGDKNPNEVEEASAMNKTTEEENQGKTIDETVEANVNEDDLSEVEKVKQDHPYFVETIELYERAIEEEWNMEKLAENGISLEYEDPTATLPDDYGFQVIKSDDEKIPPLLATGSYINDLPYVHEIYTVDNGKSSRHFVDGIRTHLSIYQDGTIVERYGDRFITFFKINEQGEPDKLASYEFDGNHYISKEESLTENELNDMFAQLAADIGEVNYDFTPFIQDKSETQEANGALSLGEMTEIKEENYSKIEAYLINPSPVDQIFNKYHSYEGARMMWENGIDKSTPFYEELYDFYVSQVDDIVSEDGMEAFINAMFSRYYDPVSTDSFFKPESDYEIVDQTDDQFTLKQTKIIGPQEAGGNSFLHVYHITYELEDDRWKFADLETIVRDEEITDEEA